jgi:hypothetical protein
MRNLVITGVCLVMMIVGCASQEPQEQPEPQLYTANNIWRHEGELFCINFKNGGIIG